MSCFANTAVIPNAGAFAATARPMRPRPMIPSCFPRSSVPSSDQVPELRNAMLPDADTDATADAVSWQAGATTGVPA